MSHKPLNDKNYLKLGVFQHKNLFPYLIQTYNYKKGFLTFDLSEHKHIS